MSKAVTWLPKPISRTGEESDARQIRWIKGLHAVARTKNRKAKGEVESDLQRWRRRKVLTFGGGGMEGVRRRSVGRLSEVAMENV